MNFLKQLQKLIKLKLYPTQYTPEIFNKTMQEKGLTKQLSQIKKKSEQLGQGILIPDVDKNL